MSNNNDELDQDLLARMFFRIQVEEARNLKTNAARDDKMVNRISIIIKDFIEGSDKNEN